MAQDITFLLLQVLMEVQSQADGDQKSLLEEMKRVNAQREALREYIEDIKDFLARAKSELSNQYQKMVSQSEVEKLRLDLVQLNNALRSKRMMKKSQSMATDQKAEQVYRSLLRRPFKR